MATPATFALVRRVTAPGERALTEALDREEQRIAEVPSLGPLKCERGGNDSVCRASLAGFPLRGVGDNDVDLVSEVVLVVGVDL